MTPPQPPLPSPGPGSAPGTLGPLLVALRRACGWTQTRVAERLCAAAGVTTVTRNEISRWERQQRLPGDFWLGWLATVFEVPVTGLVAAARATRRSGIGGPPGGDDAVRTGSDRLRGDLLALAHRWLADPADRLGGLHPGLAVAVAAVADRGEPAVAAELVALRRLDDQVGGIDLRRIYEERLSPIIAAPRDTGGSADRDRPDRVPDRVGGDRSTRRRLRLVAEAAQLAGWLGADAGDTSAALGAYRSALTAAAVAGDRPLGAYVLGCASHLLAGTGDAADALLLARTGYAGVRRGGPAGVRALMLHRVAFAAARDGRTPLAWSALTAAGRVAVARDRGRDPGWLYWLDDAELSAMTGRCLAAAGRPLRAAPLLAAALRRPASSRGAAIYRAWLARAYVDLGELEQACELAETALLDAVRAGSARAAAELTAVRRRLSPYADEPAVGRHLAAASAVRAFLPSRGER